MNEPAGNNRASLATTNELPPVQFGLKTIFVVTAVVAVLSAGASAGGVGGLLITVFAVCVASCIVTYWVGRLRLSNLLGILAVLALCALLLIPPFLPRHIWSSKWPGPAPKWAQPRPGPNQTATQQPPVDADE